MFSLPSCCKSNTSAAVNCLVSEPIAKRVRLVSWRGTTVLSWEMRRMCRSVPILLDRHLDDEVDLSSHILEHVPEHAVFQTDRITALFAAIDLEGPFQGHREIPSETPAASTVTSAAGSVLPAMVDQNPPVLLFVVRTADHGVPRLLTEAHLVEPAWLRPTTVVQEADVVRAA